MEAVGYVVVIKRDGTDGPKFTIESSTNNVTFGRDEATDIRVQLPGVGLKHCQLNINDGKITLENFSDNLPTTCNKICVEKERLLTHNDVFSIAHRSFRIEYTKNLEKASPNKENYSTVPFGIKSMPTDSISPMRNDTKLHNLDCPDSKVLEKMNMLPLRIFNKDNSATEKVINTPKSLLKRVSLSTKKRVSFGAVLSPEYFDKRLPPITPIRRGASPGRFLGAELSIQRTPLFPDCKHSTSIESHLTNNAEVQTSDLDNILLSFDSESNVDIFDDSPTTKSKLPAPIQAEVMKSWKNNLLPSVNEEQESHHSPHISPRISPYPVPNRSKKRILRTPLRKEIQSKPSLRKTLRKGLTTPLRKQIIQGVTLKKAIKRTIKLSNIAIKEIAEYPNNSFSKNKDLAPLYDSAFQFDLSNQKLLSLERQNVSLCEVNKELDTPLKKQVDEGLLFHRTENLKTPLRNEIKQGKSLTKTKKKLQTPLRKQIMDGLSLRQTRKKLQTPLRNQIRTRITLRKTLKRLQTPLKTQITEGLLLRQTKKKLQTPLRKQIQGGMSLRKSMKKLQTPLRIQISKGLALRQTKKKLQTLLKNQIQEGMSLRQTKKKLQTPLKKQITEGLSLRQTKAMLQTPLRKQIQGGMSLRQTKKRMQTPLKKQITEGLSLRQTKAMLQTPLRKQIQLGMSLRQTKKMLQTPLRKQISEGLSLRQTKKMLKTPLRKQISEGLSLRQTKKMLQTPLRKQISEGLSLRQTKKILKTPLRKQIQEGILLHQTKKMLKTPLKKQIQGGMTLRQTMKKLQTPIRKQISEGLSLRETKKKLQTPLKKQITEGLSLRQTKKMLKTPLRKQIQEGMSLRQTMKKLQTPLKKQISEGLSLRQTKLMLQTPLRKQIQGGMSLRQTKKKLQTPLRKEIQGGMSLRQTMKKLQTPLKKQISEGLSLRPTKKMLQTPLRKQIQEGLSLHQTKKMLQTPIRKQIQGGKSLRQTKKKLQTPLKKQISEGLSLRQTKKMLQTPLRLQIQGGVSLRQTIRKLQTPLKKQITEGLSLRQTKKMLQTPLKRQIEEGLSLRETMKKLQTPLKNQIVEGLLLCQTKKKLQTPLRKQIQEGLSLRQTIKKLQTPLKNQIGEGLLLRQTKKKLLTPLRTQIRKGLVLRQTKKKLQSPLRKQIQESVSLRQTMKKLQTPLEKENFERSPSTDTRKKLKTTLNQMNGAETNVRKILKAQRKSSRIHQESITPNSAEVPNKDIIKSSVGKQSRKGKVLHKKRTKDLLNEQYTINDNSFSGNLDVHIASISETCLNDIPCVNNNILPKYDSSASTDNVPVENENIHVVSANNSEEDCAIDFPNMHLISVMSDFQNMQKNYLLNSENSSQNTLSSKNLFQNKASSAQTLTSTLDLKNNDYPSDASNTEIFVEHSEVDTMFKNVSAKDMKFGEKTMSKSFSHDIRDLPSPTFEKSGSNIFSDIENSIYVEQNNSFFTHDMLEGRSSLGDRINTSISDSVSEDVATYQILPNVLTSEAMAINLHDKVVPDTVLQSESNFFSDNDIVTKQLNKKVEIHQQDIINKEKVVAEKLVTLNKVDEINYPDIIVNKRNSFIDELVSLNKEDEIFHPYIVLNKEKGIIDELVSLNKEVFYPDIIRDVEDVQDPISKSNENKHLLEQPANQINELCMKNGKENKNINQEIDNSTELSSIALSSIASSSNKRKKFIYESSELHSSANDTDVQVGNFDNIPSARLTRGRIKNISNKIVLNDTKTIESLVTIHTNEIKEIPQTGRRVNKKQLKHKLVNDNRLNGKEFNTNLSNNDQPDKKQLTHNQIVIDKHLDREGLDEKLTTVKLLNEKENDIKNNSNRKLLDDKINKETNFQNEANIPGKQRTNLKNIVVDLENLESEKLQPRTTQNIRRSARSNQVKGSVEPNKVIVSSKETNGQLNTKQLKENKNNDGQLKEKYSENIKVNYNQLGSKQLEVTINDNQLKNKQLEDAINDNQLKNKQLEDTIKSEALQTQINMPGKRRRYIKKIVDDFAEDAITSEKFQVELNMPGKRRKNVENVNVVNQSEQSQPVTTDYIRRSARSKKLESDKVTTKEVSSKQIDIICEENISIKALEDEFIVDKLIRNQFDSKLKIDQQKEIFVENKFIDNLHERNNEITSNNCINDKQLKDTLTSEASFCSELNMPRRRNVRYMADPSEELQTVTHNITDRDPSEELQTVTHNIRCTRSKRLQQSDKILKNELVAIKKINNIPKVVNNEQSKGERQDKLISNNQLKEAQHENNLMNNDQLKEAQHENNLMNNDQLNETQLKDKINDNLKKKQFENKITHDNQIYESLKDTLMSEKNYFAELNISGKRRKNVKSPIDIVNQSDEQQVETMHNIRRSARSKQLKTDKIPTKELISIKETDIVSDIVNTETVIKSITVSPVMDIINDTHLRSSRSMRLKGHESKLQVKVVEQSTVKESHSIDFKLDQANNKIVSTVGKTSTNHDKVTIAVEDDYDKKNSASPTKKSKIVDKESNEGSKVKIDKIIKVTQTTRSTRRRHINDLSMLNVNQSNNPEVEPGSVVSNNVEVITGEYNSKRTIQTISRPSTRSRRGKDFNQALDFSKNISLESIQNIINDADVIKITEPPSKSLKGKKKVNTFLTDTTQAKDCLTTNEYINSSNKDKPTLRSEMINVKYENLEKDSKTRKYRPVVDRSKPNRRKR